jgi:hypothetical protein
MVFMSHETAEKPRKLRRYFLRQPLDRGIPDAG